MKKAFGIGKASPSEAPAQNAAPKKKRGLFSKIGSALTKPAKMAHKATMGTAKAGWKATKKMTPGI
jgi:hypothetical protein